MPAVTFAKALDVIKAVADGETTLAACEANFISAAQFRAALKREPKLREMYEEAQEILDDILADSLIDQSKMPSDPKQASVWSANVRFLLERRRPAKYGKVAENSSPDSEQNRLLALALNAAIDRLPNYNRGPVIADASFTIVEPEKKASPARATPSDIREYAPENDGVAELKRLGLI